MGTFIEGLPAEICREVKGDKPRTMPAAISCACMQEEKFSEETRCVQKPPNKFSAAPVGGMS